jgi:hypothetical protein
MKSRPREAKYAVVNGAVIRPAADSRRGSEKAERTAKELAARARQEIADFKSRR